MASTSFCGPYGSNIWHKGPIFASTGTLTADRNGSTINVSISCSNWFVYSGSYGYPVYIKLLSNGNEICTWTTDSGGDWSFSGSTSFVTNDAVTLTVVYVCGQTGGCSKGYGWNVMSGSLSIGSYNPNTPATNVTRGKVYTTNNTNPNYGATVSDKPDLQIWFDWWGQSSGVGNPISYYNVDIRKNSNDSSGASSYSATDHYTQNTRLSLFNMCKQYNAKVGDTLYCWVNTYVGGATNAWLGRVYLGAVKIVQNGIIYYKDGSGAVHVCTTGYGKDTSGSNHKARYVQLKDTSGAAHNIDVYTTLYE